MPPHLPDVARLQPTPESLHVILKSTNFKDDILASGEKIKFRLGYRTQIPVLVFRFPEPSYDFLQILTPDTIWAKGDNWLNQNPVIITLMISDPVITDQFSTMSFAIDVDEVKNLKNSLNAMKLLSKTEVQELEKIIAAHTNDFFI